MATYANNLRLTEITTGDESGTWGTTTNNNWEFSTAALGYGLKSMATDADVTYTMADGSVDTLRSMYLKVTSGVSLTATRTITIAPNTVSKVWIIENATTGSQSIIIKQGSGATITIATGTKAMVYTDGAGSTAAVFNAAPTASTSGTVTSVAATVPSLLSVSGSPITSSGTLAFTYSGTALPIANGGTGASTAAGANAALQAFTTTATAGATTTLTNTSTYYQYFTGITTQTVVMPVTSTLSTGWSFHICNNSTGNITVNSSGANLIGTIIPGTTIHITCIDTTVTTAAGWDFGFTDFGTITGTGSAVLATSPTLTTPTVTGYTETVTAGGTVTSTKTIVISTGTVYTATLTSATACTFTMPTATAGTSFLMLLKQPASGTATTATFTSVKWGTAGAPTITATVGKMDILTFVADGTNWYGSAAQGYTY